MILNVTSALAEANGLDAWLLWKQLGLGPLANSRSYIVSQGLRNLKCRLLHERPRDAEVEKEKVKDQEVKDQEVKEIRFRV